ncbi:MAG: hypothetical protein ABIW47_07295 [Ginsengibacter sp.]|jgi:hypothetical protein
MKRIQRTFATIIVLSLSACVSGPEVNLNDPLASGRGFIESALKADYVQADKYLLQDSTNHQYLEGLIDFNKSSGKEERENYRDANIIIDSLVQVSDSVNILYYKNSYKKVPSKLKLVKENNTWLVDFKYSFTDEK